MSIQTRSRNCPNCFSRPCVAEENVSTVPLSRCTHCGVSGFFHQVKERLRCSIGLLPTELDAMWTPQSDGKREWLCFIERKDKSFVSNCGSFIRENVFIFRFCERKSKNTGTFFRHTPCFSHRSPSFSGRPPALGRNRWLISRSPRRSFRFPPLSLVRPRA